MPRDLMCSMRTIIKNIILHARNLLCQFSVFFFNHKKIRVMIVMLICLAVVVTSLCLGISVPYVLDLHSLNQPKVLISLSIIKRL